jgi:hypothetical protein
VEVYTKDYSVWVRLRVKLFVMPNGAKMSLALNEPK